MIRSIFFIITLLVFLTGCEQELAVPFTKLEFTKNNQPWDVKIQIKPTEEKDSCSNCVDILFSEKDATPDSLSVYNVPLAAGKYTLNTWNLEAKNDTCSVKFLSHNKDYSIVGEHFKITSISENKDTVRGEFNITFLNKSRLDTIAINSDSFSQVIQQSKSYFSTIAMIILFLFLSALFSGSEIAFVSANKLRVELKKNKGSRRGRILARFYDKPADFLGTMLVGNNIALVIFTTLMTTLLAGSWFGTRLGGEDSFGFLFASTIFITLIVLVFGEFLPKTLFRLFADDVLYFLAYPLRLIQWLLASISWVMIRLSNLLLKVVLKSEIAVVENALTRVDLGDFIRSSVTDAEDEVDTELIENVLQLRDVRVRDCMIPRPEVEDVDVNDSIEDLKQLFRETKLSRIIVTEDDIDNVLGYVHHSQMLKKPKDIRRLILNIPYVPEAMKVQDLMNRFISKGTTLACVVDEYGGVAGIITLEDILEEIFGEIEDEHDQEEYIETQVSETEFIFSGRLEIDHLNEKYEAINIPEGEYKTLSGYIVMTTATIPEPGAEIELDGYRFILELVSETKIETIRVVKLETEEPAK